MIKKISTSMIENVKEEFRIFPVKCNVFYILQRNVVYDIGK